MPGKTKQSHQDVQVMAKWHVKSFTGPTRKIWTKIAPCYVQCTKPHDAAVKFDTYRNLRQHRAVLPAIARLLFRALVVWGYLRSNFSGGPRKT